MDWRVVLEQDPQTREYAVWCPELSGCVSAGRTEQEAMANIKEAIALYLEPEPLDLPPSAFVREVAV